MHGEEYGKKKSTAEGHTRAFLVVRFTKLLSVSTLLSHASCPLPDATRLEMPGPAVPNAEAASGFLFLNYARSASLETNLSNTPPFGLDDRRRCSACQDWARLLHRHVIPTMLRA